MIKRVFENYMQTKHSLNKAVFFEKIKDFLKAFIRLTLIEQLLFRRMLIFIFIKLKLIYKTRCCKSPRFITALNITNMHKIK